ncbi:MAG: RNA-binding S4 domain-containing protein [Selenomonadales bacterium]|nr:RNA-binding S4 domain-containing protein [Selenomonadales bacterium]MBQ2245797.1 RNA-binding S4 domain-containing protein [Selenomonadales bacterium]MBQ5635957.1 RNA-binding S4 domain-containing protein [Selenomonadales bacterium]MBQ5833092.1 RNA-binding S4 domain-containing protein [Selenomonadales bacterium]MBQ5860105.1 RNA-binding S4 domain-containing protein [Selenomonadales bacterium]
METITIKTEKIQLDQLLKREGIIETGGQVRFLLDDQMVYLNGALVTEKRRQIRVGDVLSIVDVGEFKIEQE